ncbi:MAG: hypothetical protein JNJ71_00545 [Rubrivivax sp.]|nr:hypothetical protein [Rubrivivax sp.]
MKRRQLLRAAGWPTLGALLPGAWAPLAQAQAPVQAQMPELPTMLGRLSAQQGPVEVAQGGQVWREALLNMPVSHDSQFRLGAQARAELRLGGTALFLGALSAVHLRRWDAVTLDIEVLRGRVAILPRMPAAPDIAPSGVRLQTGPLEWRLAGEGSYHVGHLPGPGRLELDVFEGEARWLRPGAQARSLRAGQALTLDTRRGAVLSEGPAEQRQLDVRAALRQRRAERADPALRLSPGLTGAEELPGVGVWRSDPRWGWLWTPTAVDPAWAPFRQGQWWWLAPWGWHWVDDQPWGFVTAHHGRWIFAAGRWSWAPGLFISQPVAVPATVAFLELPGAPGGPSPEGWIGWFPLAPGEPYRPPFDMDDRYRVLLQATQPDAREPSQLRHAQTSFAVSMLPRGRFGQADARASEVTSPTPAQLAGARALDARRLPVPRVTAAPGPR